MDESSATLVADVRQEKKKKRKSVFVGTWFMRANEVSVLGAEVLRRHVLRELERL